MDLLYLKISHYQFYYGLFTRKNYARYEAMEPRSYRKSIL